MPFYDSFAVASSSKLGSKLAGAFSDKVLKKMLAMNSEAETALEIGPGRGTFEDACIKVGMQYTAVDISFSLLRGLKSKRKINGAAQALPISNDTFDIVFASNVLEHMPGYQGALSFLGEMKRVVKPRGIVCIRVPNTMAWGMHFWNGDYTHAFPTTPRNVSQAFFDLGLTIQMLSPVSGPVFGLAAHFSASLAKLIPSWLINHGAKLHDPLVKKIYSLKTSFLLGFVLIARKDE